VSQLLAQIFEITKPQSEPQWALAASAALEVDKIVFSGPEFRIEWRQRLLGLWTVELCWYGMGMGIRSGCELLARQMCRNILMN